MHHHRILLEELSELLPVLGIEQLEEVGAKLLAQRLALTLREREREPPRGHAQSKYHARARSRRGAGMRHIYAAAPETLMARTLQQCGWKCNARSLI